MKITVELTDAQTSAFIALIELIDPPRAATNEPVAALSPVMQALRIIKVEIRAEASEGIVTAFGPIQTPAAADQEELLLRAQAEMQGLYEVPPAGQS